MEKTSVFRNPRSDLPYYVKAPSERCGRFSCSGAIFHAGSWMWFTVLIPALMIMGCGGGDGLERYVVSGIVTYRDAPLKQGVIRLVPLPGTETAVSGTDIVDGQYTLDKKGGVPVGSYKVEIRLVTPLDQETIQTGEDSDVGMAKHDPMRIPAKYNTDSQLELTIAPGSGRIEKNFHLTD